jgi:uncharacterized protein YndB with AHSA1/START domain
MEALPPAKHVTGRRIGIRCPIEEVYAVLTDFEKMPQWNSLKAPMETVTTEPNRKVIRRFTDPNLPFGGTWTLELFRMVGGTEVVLTEEGFLRGVVARFKSQFLDRAANAEQFLLDLAKRMGIPDARTRPLDG